MNPRANGQVERMVRVVKEGLRKLTTHCSDMRWWEVLPDIARGMRLLPKRSTGWAPFVLVFKQSPVYSVPLALEGSAVEDFVEDSEQWIAQLTAFWNEI